MEKVKIPKDVAYAITVMRANDISNYDIVKSLNSDYWYADAGYNDEEVKNANYVLFNYFIKDTENNPEKIIQALVNGYEFELTPEEKVKKLYDDKVAESVSNNSTEEEKWFASGVSFAIKQTLKYLGIKINGI